MTKGWWFAPPDNRLDYGDGRRVRKGVTHKVSRYRPLELCGYGLHASILPLDALTYAPDDCVAWRVELTGPIEHGNDKMCAYERTYIRRVKDTDAVLRHFARLCALDVIDLWDAPDVVVRYLRTGDESVRAAARAAAWDAARAAALAAAWDAAWATARATARAAALADALGAAWGAARDKQNRRLHRMLMDAIRRDDG